MSAKKAVQLLYGPTPFMHWTPWESLSLYVMPILSSPGVLMPKQQMGSRAQALRKDHALLTNVPMAREQHLSLPPPSSNAQSPLTLDVAMKASSDFSESTQHKALQKPALHDITRHLDQ